MRDTFKQNLASIRMAEKTASEAHAKFMKTKESEFETMQTAFDDKQKQLGDNDEELAGQREMLEETKAELASDEEFLAKLLVMCAKKAKEFEERKMMRANEEAAISKAIAILNSDEAFESFGKVKATKSGATGLALVQIGQHIQHMSARESVLRLLQKAARSQKSLKIARIAMLLEADNPFKTVLDEIDKMIALIDEEQKSDEEQKEWCETERDENHKKKEEKEAKIEDLNAKIEELVDRIDNPETGLKAMIKQTEEDLKKNHDDQVSETASRQEENKAYQINIKNIVTAEGLLKKAIKVLKAYYDQFEKEEEKELLQEDPAPPETWEDEEEQGGYAGQREAGGDVITMLEFIAKETKKEETEAHSDEEGAQHDYEDSMAELKSEQAKLSETLASLQDELAEAEKDLGERRENLAVTEKELKAVKKYLLKIKPGCDYIEENFDVRTENRGKEKEALEKAIELLKGTPAYMKAVNKAEQEALGDCKDICNAEGRDHAKCEACLAGVSVPGYCAGHKDTPGC